jgi:hypothetical protein
MSARRRAFWRASSRPGARRFGQAGHEQHSTDRRKRGPDTAAGRICPLGRTEPPLPTPAATAPPTLSPSASGASLWSSERGGRQRASLPATKRIVGRPPVAVNPSPIETRHGACPLCETGTACAEGLAAVRFVLLTCEKGRYALEECAVPYDLDLVFEELERRGVPEREFIRRVFFGAGQGSG